MKADLTAAQTAALESVLAQLRQANPGREEQFRLSRSGGNVGYTPPGSGVAYLLYATHIAGPEIVDCRGPGGACPTFPAGEF
jgi:hypothetical protein